MTRTMAFVQRMCDSARCECHQLFPSDDIGHTAISTVTSVSDITRVVTALIAMDLARCVSRAKKWGIINVRQQWILSRASLSAFHPPCYASWTHWRVYGAGHADKWCVKASSCISRCVVSLLTLRLTCEVNGQPFRKTGRVC